MSPDLDEETGNYDYYNRFYSPTLGRFFQYDPIGYGDGMNMFAYTHNNPINYTDPSGLLTIPGIGWVDAGEEYAQKAVNYWANQAAQTNNPLAGGFYNLMGGLASLWTPCTSNATATTLAFGIWEARPLYQYYPAGNPGYTSSYFTRGWGWGAPYKTGQEAVSKLALPKYNPGTAVRRANVNPFQYLKGPSKVKPSNDQLGGGTEYVLP